MSMRLLKGATVALCLMSCPLWAAEDVQVDHSVEIKACEQAISSGKATIVIGVAAMLAAFAFIPYETVEYDGNSIETVEHGNPGLYYGLLIGGGATTTVGIASINAAKERLNKLKFGFSSLHVEPWLCAERQSAGLAVRLEF